MAREKNFFGEIGGELARIRSSYQELSPKMRLEAGLCRLHDPLAEEKKLNRHYAVSGPEAGELSRSKHSSVNGNTIYCMFTLHEFVQWEGREPIHGVSRMQAQIKINKVEFCTPHGILRHTPWRYVVVQGNVHQTSHQSIMSVDAPAAAPVVNVGDRVEILYDTETCSGRILGVARRGNSVVRTYKFVPQKFIMNGGFAKVTLDLIGVRPKILPFKQKAAI